MHTAITGWVGETTRTNWSSLTPAEWDTEAFPPSKIDPRVTILDDYYEKRLRFHELAKKLEYDTIVKLEGVGFITLIEYFRSLGQVVSKKTLITANKLNLKTKTANNTNESTLSNNCLVKQLCLPHFVDLRCFLVVKPPALTRCRFTYFSH